MTQAMKDKETEKKELNEEELEKIVSGSKPFGFGWIESTDKKKRDVNKQG